MTLSLQGFQAEVLRLSRLFHACYISAYPIFCYLINLTLFNEENNLRRSLLCSFRQILLICYLLGPKISEKFRIVTTCHLLKLSVIRKSDGCMCSWFSNCVLDFPSLTQRGRGELHCCSKRHAQKPAGDIAALADLFQRSYSPILCSACGGSLLPFCCIFQC